MHRRFKAELSLAEKCLTTQQAVQRQRSAIGDNLGNKQKKKRKEQQKLTYMELVGNRWQQLLGKQARERGGDGERVSV